jgi:hypothetical protein
VADDGTVVTTVVGGVGGGGGPVVVGVDGACVDGEIGAVVLNVGARVDGAPVGAMKGAVGLRENVGARLGTPAVVGVDSKFDGVGAIVGEVVNVVVSPDGAAVGALVVRAGVLPNEGADVGANTFVKVVGAAVGAAVGAVVGALSAVGAMANVGDGVGAGVVAPFDGAAVGIKGSGQKGNLHQPNPIRGEGHSMNVHRGDDELSARAVPSCELLHVTLPRHVENCGNTEPPVVGGGGGPVGGPVVYGSNASASPKGVPRTLCCPMGCVGEIAASTFELVRTKSEGCTIELVCEQSASQASSAVVWSGGDARGGGLCGCAWPVLGGVQGLVRQAPKDDDNSVART